MKEMLKLKQYAEQFKGLDMEKVQKLMDDPSFKKMVTDLISGKSITLEKERIDFLKSTVEYKESQKIRDFVDEIEKNGVNASQTFLGTDTEIRDFLLKNMKS